jgi:hypothetical protein
LKRYRKTGPDRGREQVIQFVHADFVEAASELPSAAVVALDRVVCCYPSINSSSAPRSNTPSAVSPFPILGMRGTCGWEWHSRMACGG